MRSLSIFAVVGLAAAALSACNKDAEKKVDAAVPAPARKAGLWEQTTNIAGAPPQVMKLCTNPKVDATLPWWGGVAAAGNCKAVSGKKNPDGSWGTAETLNNTTWGTCFAILFLKQATHRLDVASTDRK